MFVLHIIVIFTTLLQHNIQNRKYIAFVVINRRSKQNRFYALAKISGNEWANNRVQAITNRCDIYFRVFSILLHIMIMILNKNHNLLTL